MQSCLVVYQILNDRLKLNQEGKTSKVDNRKNLID